MRIELQPAYLLHARPYSDTSVIADFWTRDCGRIAVLAKGARRRKGVRPPLFAFTPLLLSCQGRGELKTLTQLETASTVNFLEHTSLYCGYYLNELLIRLLPVGDPHPQLFSDYCAALEVLLDDADIEVGLRCFEWSLLRELGYRLDFKMLAPSGRPIKPDGVYCFDLRWGIVDAQNPLPEQVLYRGRDLLAMAAGDYTSAVVRRAAKLLAREALSPLLGRKPLNSREQLRALLQK